MGTLKAEYCYNNMDTAIEALAEVKTKFDSLAELSDAYAKKVNTKVAADDAASMKTIQEAVDGMIATIVGQEGDAVSGTSSLNGLKEYAGKLIKMTGGEA